MTEEEWLTCGDPQRMIQFLSIARFSDRKARLFVLDCCRRLTTPLPDERLARVVATVEEFADGKADDAQLSAAIGIANEVVEWEARHDMASWRSHAAEVVSAAATCPPEEYTAISEFCDWAVTQPTACGDPRLIVVRTLRSLADLVRELTGNPFRPVALDPAWRTSAVVDLARGVSDERAFDRLPILADALQDAGCDNDDILTHCRADASHARGCWVVDLLLGKE